MTEDFNYQNVLRWMRVHKEQFRDPLTLEINATLLAESAANAFDADFEYGPLDDPNHWIWEIAIEVA